MLLTKEQAETQWCPFAKPENRTGNRDLEGFPDEGYFCLASNCMMWRWMGFCAREGQWEGQWEGYCGLAGIPSLYEK